MSSIIGRLTAGLSNIGERRLLLTLASGVLIVLAVVARWGVGSMTMWSVFMVSAAVVAGSDIAVRAWYALRARSFSIELLVTVAAGGALIIGEYWEAAAVTFLFMLGAWLEARTMRRTRGALRELLDAAPAVATVLRDGESVDVLPHEVLPAETVLVRPGQKIPVDGEVLDGSAAVDESAITGEPVPAEKVRGTIVFAGTIAHGGMLRVRATGIGADTTLARIIRRVEEAQEERAPTQRMIERFSRWYTPAVMVLALLALAITSDVGLALTLLVVACPGALVISTPVSVVAGIGRAARNGILIKGGEHLEAIGRVTTLAVDKTGTLTEGRPRLMEVVPLEHSSTPGMAKVGMSDGKAPAHGWSARSDDIASIERDLVRIAAVAESGSAHPLGRPIVEAASNDGPLPAPDALEEHAGMGVSAIIAGQRVAVGNRRLMDRLGVELNHAAERELNVLRGRGRTPVLVAIGDAVAGLLGLADSPRDSAASALAELENAGVRRIVMLTGDDPVAARHIAGHVGIGEVRAGLLPEQKVEHVRRLQAEGEHVAMLGDGINDAPALAAADVSIAMGVAGSDLAIETADIALMSDDLRKVAEAIGISRATLGNMRQNLAIAMLTAGGLLAGVLSGHVHMAAGMLVHQLSVLLVVANGMRLLRRTEPGGVPHATRARSGSRYCSLPVMRYLCPSAPGPS